MAIADLPLLFEQTNQQKSFVDHQNDGDSKPAITLRSLPCKRRRVMANVEPLSLFDVS